MAGLVPAIHVFQGRGWRIVDARHKAGHDDVCVSQKGYRASLLAAAAISICRPALATTGTGRKALEEAAHFVPGAAVEQIVVARLRHHDHALRLGGGVEHVARRSERDDGIASAMDDAERRLDRADAVDGAVLVGHDQATAGSPSTSAGRHRRSR